MPRYRRPPSQSWKTFLRNHAPDIAALDVLVVPTVGFNLLYCLVVLGHDRWQLISFGITAHPTAEWLARQITEAFPWDERPRYLIRDRAGIYGDVFTIFDCDSIAYDGYSRSTDCCSIALAERLC